MAKEELFHSWFYSTLMRLAQAFPVRNGASLTDVKMLLQDSLKVLNEGLVLGIFPEGSRSETGKLSRGNPGVALIALRSGAPILPVGISGTDKLKGTGWLKRPKVVMKIGEPFRLSTTYNKHNKLKLMAVTEQVMKKIAPLLPDEYRGEYRQV